ncbi:glyoxalase [Sphingomonas suaedae]|uniref:Glyoxalase n=1 Tax=Sphingomonas suaedae TaxID=2599297 RepID=A0A518RGD5_9SPHN|nr:VOC family protein [Sphingomonas suaedae]QDX26518.1 glyoxalase [Sphingomonas suaedae]
MADHRPDHRIAAILPCRDLAASTAFYERLGLTLDSDYGDYRILSDGKGWHLHLRHESSTPGPPDNAFGLYLYVADVDAVADRVRELVIEPGAPHLKPWGMYEFVVSDPDGTLVRVGREA